MPASVAVFHSVPRSLKRVDLKQNEQENASRPLLYFFALDLAAAAPLAAFGAGGAAAAAFGAGAAATAGFCAAGVDAFGFGGGPRLLAGEAIVAAAAAAAGFAAAG